MFYVDGLTGIKEAIEAAYPGAEIQKQRLRICFHQIRYLRKYCIWQVRMQ
ncbi:MAG TPA: hypothetical protein GX498_08760 [Clostridiales bacterium]|nr:hypothetical protein [Clostridiales bacterium]